MQWRLTRWGGRSGHGRHGHPVGSQSQTRSTLGTAPYTYTNAGVCAFAYIYVGACICAHCKLQTAGCLHGSNAGFDLRLEPAMGDRAATAGACFELLQGTKIPIDKQRSSWWYVRQMALSKSGKLFKRSGRRALKPERKMEPPMTHAIGGSKASNSPDCWPKLKEVTGG